MPGHLTCGLRSLFSDLWSPYVAIVSVLALALPVSDLEALRFRVRKLADDRPGTYRMVDAAGRVLYVGKAKALRPRLLSYFRARYPDDKAARILHAASDIRFDPAPSEFAAALAELAQIREHRPPFNVAMNRGRRHGFVVLTDEPAPRLLVTTTPERQTGRVYGPLPSPNRLRDAVRVLTDLLGIRDCRADMPVHYAEQGELFTEPRGAACPRFDFGTCLGPCAGRVAAAEYRSRGELAAGFLEGRTVRPIDRVITGMVERSEAGDFERAAHWRGKFEALEWLLAVTSRARAAADALSFVFRDPGARGDARAYLIVRGEVRACYPDPVTPIEREAFEAVVKEELAKPADPPGRVDAERLHQRSLVAAWFRTHPEAWRRATALPE
jgi:excinuclease ABC subunit C